MDDELSQLFNNTGGTDSSFEGFAIDDDMEAMQTILEDGGTAAYDGHSCNEFQRSFGSVQGLRIHYGRIHQSTPPIQLISDNNDGGDITELNAIVDGDPSTETTGANLKWGNLCGQKAIEEVINKCYYEIVTCVEEYISNTT